MQTQAATVKALTWCPLLRLQIVSQVPTQRLPDGEHTIIQNVRASASLPFVLMELSACHIIGIIVIIQERCVYIAYRLLGTVRLRK